MAAEGAPNPQPSPAPSPPALPIPPPIRHPPPAHLPHLPPLPRFLHPRDPLPPPPLLHSLPSDRHFVPPKVSPNQERVIAREQLHGTALGHDGAKLLPNREGHKQWSYLDHELDDGLQEQENVEHPPDKTHQSEVSIQKAAHTIRLWSHVGLHEQLNNKSSDKDHASKPHEGTHQSVATSSQEQELSNPSPTETEPAASRESDSSGATLSDSECSSRTGEPQKGQMEDNYSRINSQSSLEDCPFVASQSQPKRKCDRLDTPSPSLNQTASHSNAVPSFSCHESFSPRSKRLMQVQFQLDPSTYQKFMSLLMEQHEGSFQGFVVACLNNAKEAHDKAELKRETRKPALSKWKRTRFDQLKGTETQELALAFKSLAAITPEVEVTVDLVETHWQELNMAQIEKMLEETKKMLAVHEKVHDCPYANCSRRFSTPGNLRDHLNEHSGEEPYSCSFENCFYRFRSKQLLCRHLKKHERAHRCTFEGCNKRFAFRERLIVHQKTHSDERPLSCPWEGCGKTFKWANSLHGHLRTHTGEKPFQCTFAGCGRLFGYKVDLTRHRRTHFGQPARSSH